MALTKQELIDLLQDEVRILQHLCTKIDPAWLDYRPTPKQRSTIELLRYLTLMGPRLIQGIMTSNFDQEAWKAAAAAAETMTFEQIVAALAAHKEQYAQLLDPVSEEALAQQMDLFGRKASKGTLIVYYELEGCAAYRTQLFLYLKSCGREELTTYNLWGGMDAPQPAAV
jgi:hypothetical protein